MGAARGQLAHAKRFFAMVCAELKVQSCEPITYRHAPALTPLRMQTKPRRAQKYDSSWLKGSARQFSTRSSARRSPGEVELAEKFEVSRSAVREALVALDKEGTVIISPYKDAIVKPSGP
jgi:hypothetical protein